MPGGESAWGTTVVKLLLYGTSGLGAAGAFGNVLSRSKIPSFKVSWYEQSNFSWRLGCSVTDVTAAAAPDVPESVTGKPSRPMPTSSTPTTSSTHQGAEPSVDGSSLSCTLPG